jgi:hypothetical protein
MQTIHSFLNNPPRLIEILQKTFRRFQYYIGWKTSNNREDPDFRVAPVLTMGVVPMGLSFFQMYLYNDIVLTLPGYRLDFMAQRMHGDDYRKLVSIPFQGNCEYGPSILKNYKMGKARDNIISLITGFPGFSAPPLLLMLWCIYAAPLSTLNLVKFGLIVVPAVVHALSLHCSRARDKIENKAIRGVVLSLCVFFSTISSGSLKALRKILAPGSSIVGIYGKETLYKVKINVLERSLLAMGSATFSVAASSLLMYSLINIFNTYGIASFEDFFAENLALAPIGRSLSFRCTPNPDAEIAFAFALLSVPADLLRIGLQELYFRVFADPLNTADERVQEDVRNIGPHRVLPPVAVAVPAPAAVAVLPPAPAPAERVHPSFLRLQSISIAQDEEKKDAANSATTTTGSALITQSVFVQRYEPAQQTVAEIMREQEEMQREAENDRREEAADAEAALALNRPSVGLTLG